MQARRVVALVWVPIVVLIAWHLGSGVAARAERVAGTVAPGPTSAMSASQEARRKARRRFLYGQHGLCHRPSRE
jgi:hypothetical protein